MLRSRKKILGFICVFSTIFFSSLSFSEAINLTSQNEAKAGETISVGWTGKNPNEKNDYITIVKKGAAAGTYTNYTYIKRGNPLNLKMPVDAGEFEIRYLDGTSYATLATKPIKLTAVSASLTVTESANAGEKISITWSGPDYPQDYITIVKSGAREGEYLNYTYTRKGSPLMLQLPDEAGDYEIRYVEGQSSKTLASSPFKILGQSASIQGPSDAIAGSKVELTWQGPNNPQDFITVVKKGKKEGVYGNYTYTKKGSPLHLQLPDEAGEYEIRYAMGQSYKTLFSLPIKVTQTSASLKAPATTIAGEVFQVEWQGPANPLDYITVVRRDAKEGSWENYTYVKRGNPLNVLAPETAGDDYELRYATGQSYKTLARQPIKILKSGIPGELVVTAPIVTQTEGAVEIILDASGSMLKKQGDKRRIDIAKAALSHVVTQSLPDNVQLAFRAFGHIKADSCDGELLLAPQKLNRSQAINAINQVTPKNLAKTPIAESLYLIASDLAGINGPKLVILVTDGEETCDGNSEAVINQLKQQDIDIRLNIVGFAIDEFGLTETFKKWARLGNGHYQSAGDGSQLHQNIKNALAPVFHVFDSNNNIVASGYANDKAVKLAPGSYRVKLLTNNQEKKIAVKPKERVNLDFN